MGISIKSDIKMETGYIANLDLRRKPDGNRTAQAVAWDPKNKGFRRISGLGKDDLFIRDLMPVSQSHMIEMAAYLYDTSGLVKRYMHDTKDFVWSGRCEWKLENDESGNAYEILWKFWKENKMDQRLEKRLISFFLLGELCLPVIVNPADGSVTLTYADPANITDIITVPGLPEIVDAVILADSVQGRRFEAVKKQADPKKPGFGMLSGEIFFWSLNNLPNAKRGRSDLIHLFDFIDGFEHGLFDELDRLKLMKSFVWDVKVIGADAATLTDFTESNKNPKPGSLRAHNEQVEWNAVAPNMQNADTQAFFNLMRTYISAGMNRPDSWFGSGGKAYQTEADLMGEPTFKNLASRQETIRDILTEILQFVLDQSVLAGTIPKKDYELTVEMQAVTKKDESKIAESVSKIASSLVVGVDRGWIRNETAARIFAGALSGMGYEIDPETEAENVEEPAVSEDYKGKNI
jgi:hypothetical protein